MAKKLNITPLHDRVIVKPAAAEEKTAGGIIIPDTAKEKPQRGTVWLPVLVKKMSLLLLK